MTERNPLKVLSSSVNSTILLRLKDGTEYKGRLQRIDTYMNMTLIDTTEFQDGQAVARYGEIFVRGNNILFIKPDVEP